MKLGSIHRRTRRLYLLALLGGAGALFGTVAGCKPEVVNILADALESGILAGVPSLLEWIRQDVDEEIIDSVPTVLRETLNTLKVMLA